MLLKHSTAASLALGLLIGVIGCSGDFAVDVSVEGSRLSVVSGTLDFTYLGEVATLTLEVLDKKGQPIRANPNGVQWSVSDASVAEVDKNGVVTAVGNGTTQVQAKSGSSTSTASITVKQLITKIAVEPATFGVYVGQEVAVDAAAYDAGGSVVPGTTASWSSSASTIASVSNGRVKGVSQGSTTVLATIEGRSAAADVSVNEVQVGDPTVLRIISGSSQTGTSGAALDAPLEVAVLDDFDDPVPGIDVTWSAHDGGSITAIVSTTGSDGRASARWTLGPDEGEQVAHASVGELTAVFTATATKVTSTVASLTVAPASLTLDALGATAQLAAAVRDQNGALIADADVAWSSSSTVAAVDTNGKVTAKSVGTALIIASTAALADTSHVTVRQVPASVQLSSSSVSLNVGETHQLNVVVKDAGGTAIPSAPVTWSSSLPAVASVTSAGLVNALAEGSAMVTGASGTVAATAAINVAAPDPPPEPTGSGIWLSSSDLSALRASGPAWEALLHEAARSPGTADLADQNSSHDTRTLAAALVCARIGEYCDRARQGILNVIPTTSSARWLAVGRNLTSYVIAADLLGLRRDGVAGSAGTRVHDWIESFLTIELHLKDDEPEVTQDFRPFASGSNASAQEGAAFAAVAAYLGDEAALQRVWEAFRTFVCDPGAPDHERIILYQGVNYGWAHDDYHPCAVNPAGTSKKVPTGRPGAGSVQRIDGAIINDMRRGGEYQWPPGWTQYPWVGLEGLVPAALILHRAGFPAFEVADRAVLRTHQYLWHLRERTGEVAWFDATRAAEVKQLVNHVYGTSYPVKLGIGGGRTVGFTDWTHPSR